ncbi:MAG TPA: hypothetical protein VIH42_00780 [Thermoguttaceae bacterium]
MSNIESFILGLFLSLAVPACIFFPAWWLSFLFLPEKAIPITALSGLIIGVLLDVIFVKRWTKDAYSLNVLPLMLMYLLLSLIGFAICMGVPIFHPILGIFAGAYVGRKLYYLHADGDRLRRAGKFTAIFTTMVMLLICIFSATIALINPTTPSELQRMFNLTFTVNWWMVSGLIIVGGFTLVGFQYWATKKAANVAFHLGGDFFKHT